MPSLHTRSFLRRITKDWEIYLLQFITLSVAFATAIIIVSFVVTEFSVNDHFDKNIVRVLKKNETKEYEGRNRLSDRISPDFYATLRADKNFTSVGRVKSLNGTHAVDPGFKKYFDQSITFNDDTIRSLGYDPLDFGVYAVLADPGKQIELPADSSFSYILQPANEIHFGPRVIGESTGHGDIYCVLILTCIMSLIVALATTNFVNLSSLTLPGRSKELAIRKVAGAQRSPLLGLLAKESLSIAFISLVIGIVILMIGAGPANKYLSVDFAEWIGNNSLAAYILLTILFLLVAVSPLLPAWAFVKASPGRLLGTDTITFPRMKKVITVIQLGVSISLIVASMVIDRQISRSLIKEPGKNHDQVVYMAYPPGLTKQYLNRLKNDWPRDNPNILELTAVSHTPDNLTSRPIGEDYYRLNVDYDFKKFFRLEMARGRWFGANDENSTIVNEAFGGTDKTSIGVIKNFAGTYNLPDKPVRITVDKDEFNFVMIRVLEVNVRNTLNVISRHFEEIAGRPVSIFFLDQNYAATLAYEDRLNNLSSVLAMVSVVMACCAIYALSLSRMRDNLKQIAIRKTFGASDRQIVQRLSFQFLELMLGSLFFFGPVTYLLLREWLRNFAYSAKFDWSDPVISIGICLVIVGITNLFLLGRINGNSLKDLLRR
ncbi:MAG TPA: ABC transporter permease [Cyclobacteriaceae bacterium]|nr:ABC transporter permease [Cyclobacteriaceae bacterium]